MVKILIAKLRLISFHPILLSSLSYKSLILSQKKSRNAYPGFSKMLENAI